MSAAADRDLLDRLLRLYPRTMLRQLVALAEDAAREGKQASQAGRSLPFEREVSVRIALDRAGLVEGAWVPRWTGR